MNHFVGSVFIWSSLIILTWGQNISRIVLLTNERNNSNNELDHNLLDDEDPVDTWKAPNHFREKYPYYLAGYDFENRPVWIMESGRWNYRKIVEDGPESIAIFDKYTKQLVHRMTKSFQSRSTKDEPVTGITMISDMDGFSMIQMAHVPTVGYLLKLVGRYREWFIEHLELGICLNTNAVSHLLINLMRPVLGRVMERIHIFGTQQSKWQPQLLGHIPRNQLPEWYGGSPNFSPVKVYG